MVAIDIDEVVIIIRDFLVKQFPMRCRCCNRQYTSYKEFVETAQITGKPTSYDVQKGDWQPENPLGAISMYNCVCGSTISLSSKGIDRDMLWKLMEWAKSEAEKRGMEFDDFLEELRTIVHKTL